MSTLKDILQGIDWTGNIDTALSFGSTQADIEKAMLRVAVWSKQLEILDSGNPALSFVREMQTSIQSSGALVSLCLYKPSAASSRTFFESCLYYTFFRTHPDELSTLVTDPKYYVSKREILEYHFAHTPHFRDNQLALGLVQKLEAWYSRISAIVHGQIPGAWNAHPALSQTSFSPPTHELAVATLLEGEQIVNDLLLSTIAKRLWPGFAPDAKAFLLKGLSGQTKASLQLDSK